MTFESDGRSRLLPSGTSPQQLTDGISAMPNVFVSGSFDDLRSRQVRFLQEAAAWGPLSVHLWSDGAIRRISGGEPKFPEEERLYFLQAIRYVREVSLSSAGFDPNLPPGRKKDFKIWAVDSRDHSEEKQAAAVKQGLAYRVVSQGELAGFPRKIPEGDEDFTSQPKVIVTGCFDWLHSGHVRFFEEVSELGLLYVGVGGDQNIQLLKGEDHPMFGQEERAYMVQSIRHVHRAFVCSGEGWMDAAPEIERIKPDIYAVNEDGDRPEKREFCAHHSIEYRVLKREPQKGLPRRESRVLRGF